MKQEDVKIGMKVVPFKKSIWAGLNLSNSWKNAQKMNQPYLYVTGVQSEKISLNEHANQQGDFFLAEDFELYNDNKESLEDKIKRLQKETTEALNELKKQKEEQDFKEGNWVVITDKGQASNGSFTLGRAYRLMYDLNEKNGFSVSFDNCGSHGNGWRNSFHLNMKFRKATEREICDSIIKEAMRRGYKMGVEVGPIYDSNNKKIEDGGIIACDDSHISIHNPEIFQFMGRWVYNMKTDKWAQIIIPNSKLFGYDVKEDGNPSYINIGCWRVNKNELRNICDGAKKLGNSITIGDKTEAITNILKVLEEK